MTTAVQPAAGGPLSPNGGSSSLADVVETILDKGIVIDVHLSVAVVGIELITADARVVVASVDTYLRFAEAVDRLDLSESRGAGLPEVMEGRAKGKAIGKTADIVGEIVDRAGNGRQGQRERGR